MAGTVIIPWYATGFRSDDFERELEPVAAAALRYGAHSYAIYRAQDDRYKFQQLAEFETKLQWERYWDGPEMVHFRAIHSGWYQVPVLYGWWDKTAGGEIHAEGENGSSGNGHATNGWANGGAPHPIVEGESA
ncbi:MAG TPA: hypothetical protein VMB05_12645 [Solirubrobacteraceae bacterium]|nr:hypothetical protein [Solirubrobacteraceae bacterium]